MVSGPDTERTRIDSSNRRCSIADRRLGVRRSKAVRSDAHDGGRGAVCSTLLVRRSLMRRSGSGLTVHRVRVWSAQRPTYGSVPGAGQPGDRKSAKTRPLGRRVAFRIFSRRRLLCGKPMFSTTARPEWRGLTISHETNVKIYYRNLIT
jgi:hypothetical protein